MKRLFHSAVLIVAAMVASGLVLVAIFSITQGLGIYGNSPADVLPQDGTVLLLHKPTPQMLALFPEHIPDLPAETANEVAALAFIELSSDVRGAIVFLENASAARHRIGRYGLAVTHPLLLPLVTLKQRLLADDPDYRKLRAEVPASSPWIFASRTVLSQKKTWLSRIVSALCTGDAKTVAFVPGENVVQCSILQENSAQQQAPRNIAAIRGAFLTVSFADAEESWNRLLRSLTQDDVMLLEGLLRASLRRFGTQVSLHYDILPLFSKPGSIHLVASGATVDIVAEGNASEEDELQRILNTLHESYAATLPSSRITRRTLDKRFSSLDIRQDEMQIEKNRHAYKGWALQATLRKESTTGLLTAMRGKRFVLATTEELLREALDRRIELPSDNERNILLARGSMDLARVSHVLQNLLFEEGTLIFTSSQRDGVRSLVLTVEQKFPELLDSLP